MKKLFLLLSLVSTTSFALPTKFTHSFYPKIFAGKASNPLTYFVLKRKPELPTRPSNKEPIREDYLSRERGKRNIKRLMKEGILADCTYLERQKGKRVYLCFEIFKFKKDYKEYEQVQKDYQKSLEGYNQKLELYNDYLKQFDSEYTTIIEIGEFDNTLSNLEVSIKENGINNNFKFQADSLFIPVHCINRRGQTTKAQWNTDHFESIMKNYDLNFDYCEAKIQQKDYIGSKISVKNTNKLDAMFSQSVTLQLAKSSFTVSSTNNDNSNKYDFSFETDQENTIDKLAVYDYIDYVRNEYFIYAHSINTRRSDPRVNNELLRQRLNSMKPQIKEKLEAIHKTLERKSLLSKMIASSLITRLHTILDSFEENELRSDVKYGNTLLSL